MCGRYAILLKWKRLHRLLRLAGDPVEFRERYNIAPTQSAPVVRAAVNADRHIDSLRWGLIPSWMADAPAGGGFINARSETITIKPAFREAYQRRRCIIPASGFYEWRAIAKGRSQPHYITPAAEDDLFLFAGVWEQCRSHNAAQAAASFAILTTTANTLMSTVHERMPVILKPEDADRWLDPSTSPEPLHALLKPYPSDQMRLHPVSTLVNSPRNDSPACIEPCEEPSKDQGAGLLF